MLAAIWALPRTLYNEGSYYRAPPIRRRSSLCHVSVEFIIVTSGAMPREHGSFAVLTARVTGRWPLQMHFDERQACCRNSEYWPHRVAGGCHHAVVLLDSLWLNYVAPKALYDYRFWAAAFVSVNVLSANPTRHTLLTKFSLTYRRSYT